MNKCVLVYNKDRDIITAKESVNYIEDAIIRLGYTCSLVPFDKHFISNMIEEKPDIVFNYYTATGSSQVLVPSILETMNIRYTGSDPITQAMAIDKEYTSIILQSYKVPTPQFFTMKKEETFIQSIPFPFIVKPALGGSSEGISCASIVYTEKDLDRVVDSLFSQDFDKLIASSFIKGKELTVGVIGSKCPRVIGLIETRIKPDEILTKEIKDELEVYDERVITYSGAHYEEIKNIALKSYKAINCKGYGRIDIRLSEDGIPYVIDINTLPGLHPRYSYLPRMAEDAKLGYIGLIKEIIEDEK